MKNFLVFLLIFFVANVFAQGIRFENENRPLTEIIEQAKREHRPIFVAGYSKSCHVCEKMIEKIYPNDSLAVAYNSNFINVKMDVDAEQNIEFVSTYQIVNYPIYFFLDENGKAFHKSGGKKSVEKMLELAQTARDPQQQFFLLLERFDAGDRDSDLLRRLVFQSKDLQDYALTERVHPVYFETQTDWTTRENLDLILAASNDIEQPIFQFLLKNTEKFIAAFGEAKVKAEIDEIVLNSMSMVSYDHELRKFDLAKAKNYGSQFLPADLVDKTISIFELNQLIRRNDMANFQTAVVAHFEKFECHNPHLLNNFALRILNTSDDPQLLAKAASWAVRATKLQDTFALNDLAAAIFLKAGDRQSAKIYALKAIEIAKKTGENDAATREILKEIESGK